jgi:hypothetical protein
LHTVGERRRSPAVCVLLASANIQSVTSNISFGRG